MDLNLTLRQLVDAGMDEAPAASLYEKIQSQLEHCSSAEEAWTAVSRNILSAAYPYQVHTLLYSTIYPDWHNHPESAPAWIPDQEDINSANITRFMTGLGIKDVKTFHVWTVDHYEDFWRGIIKQLNIVFKTPPDKVCDLSDGIEAPRWLPGARLNISDSCFTAPASDPAIVYQAENNEIRKMSYGELNQLASRIANSLVKQGLAAGDAIAIAMPMNQNAVAIYLGIIKMGGVVVSIADSFSSQEIAVRLRVSNAKAIFTQDVSIWGHKRIPLYARVCDAHAKKVIVLPAEAQVSVPLRQEDIAWTDFLVREDQFESVACQPMSPCNILFSSGTTAEPKAIVWNHSTPIKAASDAWFHHNIKAGDVVAWPTNLGWMMGPWLIYASLINHAAIALYTEAPKDRQFGEFVQRAGVNILGVVPTAVASWRQSHCMDQLDWSAIKIFTSTGECSNPSDMLYLMSLAGYKPVIEYCGGTEIGGSYISSSVVQKNCPSLFTTPAMGLNIIILGERGSPAHEGEVAIIPPSIGLSTKLLNADHHIVYFADMPRLPGGKVLRRHGDQIRQFPNGYYSIMGRMDDSMNLGGIKISSAEIERALVGINGVIEVAAIAIPPPDNGPSLLVIYAATAGDLDKPAVMKEMQKKINAQLNPLFKVHDVVFARELPKTASNKIMRRILRKQYLEKTRA